MSAVRWWVLLVASAFPERTDAERGGACILGKQHRRPLFYPCASFGRADRRSLFDGGNSLFRSAGNSPANLLIRRIKSTPSTASHPHLSARSLLFSLIAGNFTRGDWFAETASSTNHILELTGDTRTASNSRQFNGLAPQRTRLLALSADIFDPNMEIALLSPGAQNPFPFFRCIRMR